MMEAPTPPSQVQHLRVALVVGVAAALSVIGVLPYAIGLMPEEIRAKLPPMWVLMTAQVLQGLVLFTLLAWIGFLFGWKRGLDAPVLRRLVKGGTPAFEVPHRAWPIALVAGVVAALAAGAIANAFEPYMPQTLHAVTPPSAARGFGASFYGAIAEELQLRLFFMTALAASIAWLSRGRAHRTTILVIAAVLAAVAFGAGHLPAASQLWPLDQVVVMRTIIANAAPGLVFAALYAKYGLESAIVAHFVADLVLHVVPRLVA